MIKLRKTINVFFAILISFQCSYANNTNTENIGLPIVNNKWSFENDTSYFDNMVFIYDSLGLLITMENQSGHVTHYKYNAAKKLIKETFADDTFIQYAYDKNGSLNSKIDENGDTIQYLYNSRRQLVKRDLPGETDDFFVYNKYGKISLAYNKHATVKLTYDENQRIRSEELNGQITQYLYSEDNKIRTIIYPNGRIIQERRNETNRLNNIMEIRDLEFSGEMDQGVLKAMGLGELMPLDLRFTADTLAAFDWANHNRLTKQSYPINGISTTFEYFDEEHVKSIEHSANPAMNQNYEYGEDDLIEIFSAAGTQRFDYRFNDRDQLASYQKNILDNPEFSNPYPDIEIEYDEAGNRRLQRMNDIETRFFINEREAYTELNSDGIRTTIKNDKKGNVTDDGRNKYTYDAAGRLTEVNASPRQLLPGRTTKFEYDPFNRRIAKIVDFDTTKYYYAGNEIIGLESSGTQEMTTYVYNTDMDIPLNMQRKDGDFFFQHDRFGSINSVSDEDGSIVEQYEYYPDGTHIIIDENQKQVYGSTIGNILGYQGMEFDASTGLYYYRGAYVKKEWGRSITRERFGTGLHQNQEPIVHRSNALYENVDEFKYCESELGCGSTEEAVLVRWANKATKENGFIFKNGAEFLKRLEDYSDENCCVDKLIIISHGWGWPRTKGTDVNGGIYGTKWVNGFLGDIPPDGKGKGFRITSTARQLSDLEKRIMAERVNFCGPCEIILTGCRVASTGNFVDRLAAMTGCKVTASHGGCDGTEAPYFSSRPKTLKERNSGEYKGFSITYPNGFRVEIGDLLKLW